MSSEQEYTITCINKNIYILCNQDKVELEDSYILLNKETYQLPELDYVVGETTIKYETEEINYSFKFDDTYDFFNIKINLYRCDISKYRVYYQEIIKELNNFFI
jgi:hypothetical protein